MEYFFRDLALIAGSSQNIGQRRTHFDGHFDARGGAPLALPSFWGESRRVKRLALNCLSDINKARRWTSAWPPWVWMISDACQCASGRMLLFSATCTCSPGFCWAVDNSLLRQNCWVVIQIKSAVNRTLGCMKVTISKQWRASDFSSLHSRAN